VATIAALAGALGISSVADTRISAGLGFLAAACVYTGLAARVFRRPGFRDVATSLWALGLLFLIGAELLLVERDQLAAIVVALTGGGVALYAVSLGMLEIAERVSTASVETDFERGHTAVSALWALVGLALLVAGLLRGSAALRYGGLVLFGLSLVKIFLYDLAELSSVARAFSFILVGALLLAGGFFLQRLSDRMGRRAV
jgi:hypothetical protein